MRADHDSRKQINNKTKAPAARLITGMLLLLLLLLLTVA